MKDKKTRLIENVKNAKVKDAVIDYDTRNKIGFLIIGLSLLILICCGIYWSFKESQDLKNLDMQSDALKFKNEYEELNGKQDEKRELDYLNVFISKNNPVVYASYKQVFEILENGTGVIYFGFPDCPWCRNLVPNLLTVAENLGLEKIYYLNALEDRDILELNENNKPIITKEGTNNYRKILDKLDAELSDYVLFTKDNKEVKTGEKRLYFPTVIVVKDGKIIGFHEGTLEEQKNPWAELTKEQKASLIKKLEEDMQGLITCEGAC